MKPGNTHETKYGSATILEYNNTFDVLVQFNDKYGHQVRVTTSNLRNGKVKNPYHPSVFGMGYIGVGYRVSIGGKVTPEYRSWQNMLMRCYDPGYCEKHPTYIGCSVLDEWLNFQNYAEWFNLNHKLGWQLDKDLLFPGNKIYSAKTCRFIPPALNTLLTDRSVSRGDLPQGVSKNNKGYQALISIDSKRIGLGTYSTVEEAAEVYKQAKELNVKRMADRYKDEICPEIYQALMEWKLAS